MSISHESVHEWWENQLADSDKQNLANMINDQTILDKAYNELSQEQQDLVLNTYYQQQDYFNPNEEEELGVMSNHSDHGEDKGWSSYPAGTASFESYAKEDYDYRNAGISAPDSMDKPHDWFDGQGEFIIDTVKEDLYQAIKNAGYYGVYYNEINSGSVIGNPNGWEVVKAKEELEIEGKIRKGNSSIDTYFQHSTMWRDSYKEPENYYFTTSLDLSNESKASEEFYDVLNPKSIYGWNGKWNDLDPDMKYKVTDAYLKERSDNFFDLSEEEKNEYAMDYVRAYNIDMEYAYAEKGGYNFKANEEQQDPEDTCERCGKNKTTHQYLDHDFSQGEYEPLEEATEYNPMAFINKQLGIKTKAKEVSQKWLDELQITRDQLKRLLENDGETMSYVNGMSQDNFEDYVTHLRNEQGSWSQVINDAMSDESYANEDSYESPMIEKGQQYTKDSFVGFKGHNPTIAICKKCGWEAGELSDEYDSNAPIYNKVREHVASVHGLVQNYWAESYVRKVKYTGNEGISLADWSKYQDENGWYRVGVSSPTPEIEDIARSMGGNYYGISSDSWGVEEWSFHNYSDAENFAQYVEGKSTSYDYGDGIGVTPEEQHYVEGPYDVSPHIFTSSGQDINIGSGAIGGHPLRNDPFGVGEAIRGKYDSWKKQDIDVRDETLDFAGVNSDIKEEILSTDMTLDEIKDGYPEEFKKLEQAGVWGFGESLSASEQWSDEEWFTEIEKLASGSGVKRIPVENFLMTLDGQTRVQAEMNFENDASVYGWNGETQEAISKGISKYFSKEVKANEFEDDYEIHWSIEEFFKRLPSGKAKCVLCGKTIKRSEEPDPAIGRYSSRPEIIVPSYGSDLSHHMQNNHGWYGASDNEKIKNQYPEIFGESKANEDVWYTVSSTKGGEYSEEEVEDLDKAKTLADDWSGVVVDNKGERVHVSDGYRKTRDEYKRDSDGKFTESKASEVVEVKGLCPNCGKEDMALTNMTIRGVNSLNMVECSNCSYQWTFKELSSFNEDPQTRGKEYNLGKQSSDVYDIIIYDKETGDWEMSIDVDNQKDLTYYKDDFKQEANRLNDEAGYKKYAVKVKNEWDSLNWSQDFSEEKVKAKEVAEKLAYYFSKGDKPIDWNDNEISNDAEKILQETYGITTKKPEVAKEVAHESHSPTQDRIIDRKLAGVKSDGIIHELMLWENMSEEQATKAVESTEIPVMDSVSFSLFNKKYSELNEVEQQEIKLYGGEAKKVNKEKDGGIV